MGSKSMSDLNEVIDIVEDRIKSNQDILKLLKFDTYETDIYEQSKLSLSEAREVIKNRIFTFPKEFTDNEMCCYMMLTYGNKTYHKRDNSYFNGNTFNIRILCHSAIVNNRWCGDRVNEIENIIYGIFDKKPMDKTGFGCEVVDSNEIQARSTSYFGRHIILAFTDTNFGD